MTDELIRGLGGAQTVRVLAATATAAADEARRAHGLTGAAARLAGEGVVATLLLGAYIKDDERIALQLQASKPELSFYGEVDADGHVRARLSPSALRLAPGGGLTGMLLAIKSDRGGERYRGHTEVRDQSLDEALTEHLRTSTQVDAVLRVHCALARDGSVAFAGGFLVERLPEHPRHPWIEPEEFAATYGDLVEVPVDETVLSIVGGELAGGPVDVIESREVVWRCTCSRQRVEATIAALGPETLQEMIDEDHGAEVTCHFCNSRYAVSETRLREILAAMPR